MVAAGSDDLDVPGVEGVLVEPHTHELREPESHGPHGGGERVPVVRRNRLDAGEQCGVGGQGVVALRDRAICRPVGGVTPR
jgi:hypothetical protein